LIWADGDIGFSGCVMSVIGSRLYARDRERIIFRG
jgi:hypothetical protein